jgi:hypothetical protein
MMRKLETEQNDAILFCFFCGMKMNEWYGVYYVFLTNDKSESI